MAKIDLKFLDAITSRECYLKVNVIDKELVGDDSYIEIELKDGFQLNKIWLDKSTAIRFAKTLRTEINKIELDG